MSVENGTAASDLVFNMNDCIQADLFERIEQFRTGVFCYVL